MARLAKERNFSLWFENDFLLMAFISLFYLFCVVMGKANELFHVQGKAAEWNYYVGAVTLFPFLVLLWFFGSQRRRWVEVSFLVSAVGYLVWLFLYSIQLARTLEIQFFSIFSLLGVVIFYFMNFRNKLNLDKKFGLRLLLSFSMIFSAWTCFSGMYWWDNLSEWILKTPKNLIFLAGFFLISLISFQTPRQRGSFNPLLIGLSLLTFCFLGLKSEHLATDPSLHHWGPFLGPATLLRDGGGLFWDVPSQYGFLNIIAIAYFPTSDRYQALFYLLFLTHVISAWVLFSIFKKQGSGWIHSLISILASSALVFFVPGWWPELSGPVTFPSTGGLRFIWCFVLLGFLMNATGQKKVNLKGFSIFGAILWILSCLWSIESAFYSTAIWMPAFSVICIQVYFESHSEKKFRFLNFLKCLSVQLLGMFGALLSVFALVASYYKVFLGYPLDVQSLLEYARAFSSVFGVLPLSLSSPGVRGLVLIFLCVCVGMIQILKKSPRSPRLALAVAALFNLWASSSYFIGKGHENNFLNVLPLVFLSALTVLFILSELDLKNWSVDFFRFVLSVALTVVLTISYTNPFFYKLVQNFNPLVLGHVHSIVPRVDPDLQSLFDEAKITETDKIGYFAKMTNMLPPYYVGEGANRKEVVDQKSWLPMTPPALFHPLPTERRDLYLYRFFNRRHSLKGWIAFEKDMGDSEYSWVVSQLESDSTHFPTRRLENQKWRLVYFESKNP